MNNFQFEWDPVNADILFIKVDGIVIGTIAKQERGGNPDDHDYWVVDSPSQREIVMTSLYSALRKIGECDPDDLLQDFLAGRPSSVVREAQEAA